MGHDVPPLPLRDCASVMLAVAASGAVVALLVLAPAWSVHDSAHAAVAEDITTTTTTTTGPTDNGTGSDNGSCCTQRPPTLSLSPNHAGAGESVLASLACYDGTIGAAATALTVDAGRTIALTPVRAATGEATSASGTFSVPADIEPGAHLLSTSCGARAEFIVDDTTRPEPPDPDLTVTPNRGKPGSPIEYHGTNLPACESWSIRFDGRSLGEIPGGRADLRAAATVPARSAGGDRVAELVCLGTDRTARATFTVLSPPPPGTTSPITSPPTRSTTRTTASTALRTTTPIATGSDPTTTAAQEDESSSAAFPAMAAMAAIGIVSALTVGGVAVGARMRRPGRWIADHVVTRPDPGPSTVTVQPPDDGRDGHSVRFDLRGDPGTQAIEEDHDDAD